MKQTNLRGFSHLTFGTPTTLVWGSVSWDQRLQLFQNIYMPGSNIDLRFQNLTTVFLQWAEDSKTTPYITILIVRKLAQGACDHNPHEIRGVVFGNSQLALDAMLVKILEAARAMNEAMTILYSNDVWLPKVVANQVGRLGRRHMELYQEMATICFRQGQALWPFMPKAQVCDHVWPELELCDGPDRRRHGGPSIACVATSFTDASNKKGIAKNAPCILCPFCQVRLSPLEVKRNIARG